MGIDLDYAKEFFENNKSKTDKREGSDRRWYSFPADSKHNGKDLEVILRFLPPMEGQKLPGKLVGTHWNIPELNKIICFKSYDLDCPMCNMLKMYKGRLELGDWLSNVKAYFNVLILSDPTYEERCKRKLEPNKVDVLNSPEYTLFWLLEQVLKPRVGDITDPVKGIDVSFQRESKGGKFKRSTFPDRTPIADSEEGIRGILAARTDLEKIWTRPDDTYFQNMKKAVALVKEVIENKIMVLSSGTGSSSSKPAPKEIKEAAGTVNESKSSNKPAGAPACFGDPKVFNLSSQDCIKCVYDFHCQEDLRRNK